MRVSQRLARMSRCRRAVIYRLAWQSNIAATDVHEEWLAWKRKGNIDPRFEHWVELFLRTHRSNEKGA
jgi:hypothetical protein